MNRDTAVALVAAGLGILAVGLAAATIEDRRDPQTDGGVGGGGGSLFEGAPEPEGSGGTLFPYLDELMFVLAVIVVVIALFYLVTHFRESLGIIALVLGAVLLVWLAVQYLPSNATEVIREGEIPPGNVSPPGPEGEGFGQTNEPIRWWPILALLGIFGFVLIAALVIGSRDGGFSVGNDAPRGNADGSGRSNGVAAAIGAAAGRAADRLESAETFENEVYRAWADMTDSLDVADPETATPGHFANQAIAAGLDPQDVRELTRLFEEVRYGERPASPERESQAIELLRRIEETYSEEE